MDREQQLAEMRVAAAKARAAAQLMALVQDRERIHRLADELEQRADDLEAQRKPANSN